jgi:hypothetical protein
MAHAHISLGRSRRRIATVLCLTAAALLVTAAAVLAATVAKGATYRGTFKAGADTPTLTFAVSANGKRVTNIRVTDTGLYCAGGGAVTPVHFKDATITAAGSFHTTGQYRITIGPKKGQVGQDDSLTGTFAHGRREHGTLTTKYVGGVPAACSGHSPYSTKAS